MSKMKKSGNCLMIAEAFSTLGWSEIPRLLKEKVWLLLIGIGYVCFANKETFLKAMQLNNTYFIDRYIRVKKAVPAKRLEKKQRQREKNVEQIQKNPAERRMQKKSLGGKKFDKTIAKKTKRIKKTGPKDKNIFAV